MKAPATPAKRCAGRTPTKATARTPARTPQRHRTDAATAASSTVAFLPATAEKLDQSVDFVKKLVAIGVSNVIYLRSNFPEDGFADRKLDGLNLKILSRKSPFKVGYIFEKGFLHVLGK